MSKVFESKELEGFEWDSANKDKNWKKRHVSTQESEEVFFNKPLLIALDQKHSKNEKRYQVLGKTNKGRFLFISCTLRDNKIRIISVRNQSRKERGEYEKI